MASRPNRHLPHLTITNFTTAVRDLKRTSALYVPTTGSMSFVYDVNTSSGPGGSIASSTNYCWKVTKSKIDLSAKLSTYIDKVKLFT